MPNINNNSKSDSNKLKVSRKTAPKVFTVYFALLAFLLLSYIAASAAEITGPEVKIQDGEIHVATELSLDEKSLLELRGGMTKEFRFYVDLFRVWKMWPDEFVIDKFFIRTLKSDPVKKEYLATSSDGATLIQRRFKSLESMLQWALSINDLRLANMRELDAGVYYIRVTIESKIRKKPPVIGYFLIFLPEDEFKISKNSSFITVGKMR